MEVRRHNVVTDALEEGAFDLVHARALLQHLLEPVSVLRKMVVALKPGGWLLVEESDVDFVVPDEVVDAAAAALFRTCWSVCDRVFTDGGGDWHYGRRVFHDVCAQSLIELGAEGRTFIVRGGSQHARFLRLSVEQLRDRVIDSGLVTESDENPSVAVRDVPRGSPSTPRAVKKHEIGAVVSNEDQSMMSRK